MARFTGLEPPGDVAAGPRRAARRVGDRERREPPRAPGAGCPADRGGDGPGDPRAAPPEMQQMAGFMLAQISPLLMGAQVGQVLGFLAQRVLGQFDVAVPRSGPGTLLFVVPNIAQFEKRLVARPHRVPDLGGAARGDAPLRVRAPVGARTVPRSCSTTSCRPSRSTWRGCSRELAGLDAADPEALQALIEIRRGSVRRRARRRAAAEARHGSRRSWRPPRGTATT